MIASLSSGRRHARLCTGGEWGGSSGDVVCHHEIGCRFGECRSVRLLGDLQEDSRMRSWSAKQLLCVDVGMACADISKITETYVLLSMSRLLCKSNSSKCVGKKSALIMSWWTSVIVISHVYLCEPMLRKKVQRPYTSTVKPLAAFKSWLRFPWQMSLADSEITLTPVAPTADVEERLIMSAGESYVKVCSTLLAVSSYRAPTTYDYFIWSAVILLLCQLNGRGKR